MLGRFIGFRGHAQDQSGQSTEYQRRVFDSHDHADGVHLGWGRHVVALGSRPVQFHHVSHRLQHGIT